MQKFLKQFLLLSFSIFIFSNCKSEITNGTTIVYSSINKGVTFKLNDNVSIDCSNPDNGWVQIVVYIPCTKDFFDGKKKVKKGDALFDSAGRKIGEILSDSVKYMPMGSAALNKYCLRVEGYISTKNILPASVPENELLAIVKSNKGDLSFNAFQPFITKWKFYQVKEFHTDYPNMVVYFFYVGYFWEHNITLLFDQGKLVSVLFRRDVIDADHEVVKMQTGNILWINKEDISGRDKFIKTYKKIFESGN